MSKSIEQIITERVYDECDDQDEAGNWLYLGIGAIAHVTVKGVFQKIASGYVWGIHFESGEDHFREVEAFELDSLQDILLELGFPEDDVKNHIAFAKGEKG